MKKQHIFLLFVLFSLFLNGCRYDFILPEAAVVIDPGQSISFATQIVPIFSTGDKCTACHKTGGQTPYLTSASAYSQISSNSVNTSNPEASKIYYFPSPTNTVSHTWKKYTSNEAALVLAWIKGGAKNN